MLVQVAVEHPEMKFVDFDKGRIEKLGVLFYKLIIFHDNLLYVCISFIFFLKSFRKHLKGGKKLKSF